MNLLSLPIISSVGDILSDESFVNYTDKNGRDKHLVAPNKRLGSGMCAMYSRLCSEEIFGRVYTPANAWDLKYSNDAFIATKNLSNGKPGDIITFFNPSSTYNTNGNKNLDIKGNPRTCTHAALLFDFDKNYNPVIIHQYTSILEAGLLDDI